MVKLVKHVGIILKGYFDLIEHMTLKIANTPVYRSQVCLNIVENVRVISSVRSEHWATVDACPVYETCLIRAWCYELSELTIRVDFQLVLKKNGVLQDTRGYCGAVVIYSIPTYEIRAQISTRPQDRKLVVACPWLPVYSTEP